MSEHAAFGVMIDGVLSVCTIAESRNEAATHALHMRGFLIVGFLIVGCAGRGDCTCALDALAEVVPGARVTELTVIIKDQDRKGMI